MASEVKDKTTKDVKGKTKTSAEIFQDLLNHENAFEDLKASLKCVNFEHEFDEVKVAKSVLINVESKFTTELERCIAAHSADPFDQLLSADADRGKDAQASAVDLGLLEFCLTAIKSIANMNLKFEGIGDILQIKFKQPLIRIVLCNKLPDTMRTEASLICERIMEMNKYLEDDLEGGNRWMSVYLWVVKCALSDSAVRNDVKRVWSMRKLLTRYSLQVNSSVFNVLVDTVTSTNFISHKEGRQFIACLLSSDKSFVVPLHAKIKSALPRIFEKSKSLACYYGEIFNLAWSNALPQVREELETQVFQRWMEIYLKLDRPKFLNASQFGKLIFRILSFLHNSRRLLELSSAITRLYQPILWRSLTSHHPLERCNAAELFLDVFPLEKPESNIVENSNFKEKQFNQIMALLKDECHYTRIVAIKGMAAVLNRRMECLSNEQCKKILSYLSNDLANDSTSHLVRVAVWQLFTSLSASDDPPIFLITLLPQMTNHFHDVNEQVRKAFTMMLIEISKNQNLTICHTDVVPVSHIIARLSLEGEAVGKLLVKLFMKSIYTEGMEILQFVKRLKRLILMCPKAAENLFKWSPQILTTAEAQFIIMGILIYLRSFTKQRVEGRPDGTGKSTFVRLPDDDSDPKSVDNDDKENPIPNIANIVSNTTTSPSASPNKKKLKKSKQNRKHQDQHSGAEEDSFDIDGPTAEMHTHLLGCAYVTWIVFSKQFESKPNIISELNNVVTVCLQNYLRCYKDTPAWYASLALASLVPVTKLSENTTASSSCLGELRRTEMSTPLCHTEALVYSLTAWHRGNEIIELAIDYIDPAFKLCHLNSSAFITTQARNSGVRVKSVRFVKDSGKQMVGLRLLSCLINDYHNEQRLILKHYDHLHDLYTYLDGIKVILEARVSSSLNQENSAVLTDEFIAECFKIYVKLISMLNRSETAVEGLLHPEFMSTNHMVSLIDWTNRVLLPHVQHSHDDSLTDEPLHDTEDKEEEDDDDDEVTNQTKAKKNKKKRKRTEKKKKNAGGKLKEDVVIHCVKAVLKATTLMVAIKQTDKAHAAASTKLCLHLLQSEGNLMFAEGCLDLISHLAAYSIAWDPKDDYQIISILCPSLYSHVHLSFISNSVLSNPTLQRCNCGLSGVKKKLMAFPCLLLSLLGSSHEIFTKVFSNIVNNCIAAVHSEAKKIEAIETVSKLEDLPLGLSIVTACTMARPKCVSLLLPYIVDFIKANIEDGALMVCGLSYLYTVIQHYKKKFIRVQMEQTVHSLYPLVKQGAELHRLSKQPDNAAPEEQDSFFDDPLAKLDVNKLSEKILQKIAHSVPCSLFQPSSPIQQRHSVALSGDANIL